MEIGTRVIVTMPTGRECKAVVCYPDDLEMLAHNRDFGRIRVCMIEGQSKCSPKLENVRVDDNANPEDVILVQYRTPINSAFVSVFADGGCGDSLSVSQAAEMIDLSEISHSKYGVDFQIYVNLCGSLHKVSLGTREDYPPCELVPGQRFGKSAMIADNHIVGYVYHTFKG